MSGTRSSTEMNMDDTTFQPCGECSPLTDLDDMCDGCHHNRRAIELLKGRNETAMNCGRSLSRQKQMVEDELNVLRAAAAPIGEEMRCIDLSNGDARLSDDWRVLGHISVGQLRAFISPLPVEVEAKKTFIFELLEAVRGVVASTTRFDAAYAYVRTAQWNRLSELMARVVMKPEPSCGKCHGEEWVRVPDEDRVSYDGSHLLQASVPCSICKPPFTTGMMIRTRGHSVLCRVHSVDGDRATFVGWSSHLPCGGAPFSQMLKIDKEGRDAGTVR